MTELWVQLKQLNPARVSTQGCSNVNHFLKVCKKKLAPILDSISIAQLSLSSHNRTFRPSDPIPEMNTAKTAYHITILDSLRILSSSSSSIVTSAKSVHPSRKRRWEKLNEVLESNKTFATSMNSVTNSNMSWDSVKHVLDYEPYSQRVKEMPDPQFSHLYENILQTHLTRGSIFKGNEDKRLAFINPILTGVAALFNGDVEILHEEDLEGTFVKARGHFQFILRRQNKIVCLVVAKKEQLEQGMVQDLVGCEVAAEIGELSCVYGIVTNYVEWLFLRSLDDKIEMDFSVLTSTSDHVTDKESLKVIVGKMYAILSEED
jgi:hypothetical protein